MESDVFERVADEMAVSFQRQGRMFTYPQQGQEAIHIAAGEVIRENDWLVPAFREVGVMLAKGVSMKEIFLYYNGTNRGVTSRMPRGYCRSMFPLAHSCLMP